MGFAPNAFYVLLNAPMNDKYEVTGSCVKIESQIFEQLNKNYRSIESCIKARNAVCQSTV